MIRNVQLLLPYWSSRDAVKSACATVVAGQHINVLNVGTCIVIIKLRIIMDSS